MGRCVYDGHLRARPPEADEDGFRRRRGRAGPRARRADPALPGRQLRLRLQLGGRRRAARTSGRRRLDLAWRSIETNQVGVDEFVALGRGGRQRRDDGGQPRHARRRRGPRPASSTATTRAARTGRTCAAPTAPPSRTASSCGASATRWTAPGRSATRPPTSTAGSPPRRRKAMRRVDPSIELVACGSSNPPDADVRRVGGDGARARPTTSSTTSRCTATTRSSTATGTASWPAPSTWTGSSTPSSRPSTTSARSRPAQQADQHLLRRVERLVPAAGSPARRTSSPGRGARG